MINELLAEKILVLAKMIHEDYNKKESIAHPDNKLVEWDDLSDDMKYSNIRQAESISMKLDFIGCYVERYDKNIPSVDRFTDEERELLSIKEHEMWVDERESSGWAYGKKNKDRKTSPYILPWKDVPPDYKEFDYNVTDNIIPFLRQVGLMVCRKSIIDDEIVGNKKYEKNKAPLIIGVTGHRSIRPNEVQRIQQKFGKLIDDLLRTYPRTDIIVMSALAEGADTILAEVALSKDRVYLAPVFPMSYSRYCSTFTEDNRDRTIARIESILSNDRTLTPCILSDESVNQITAFRRLSAYLVSNSHIIVGVWDGTDNGKRGGTSDTLRMAYGTVDNDLLDSVSPMSQIHNTNTLSQERFINTSGGPAIYWIGVRRNGADDVSDKDGFLSPMNETEDSILFKGERKFAEFKAKFEYDHPRPKNSDEKEIIKPIRLGNIDPLKILKPWFPDEYHKAFARMDSMNIDIESYESGDLFKWTLFSKRIYKERRKRIDSENLDTSFEEDGLGLLKGDSKSSEKVRNNHCLEDMARRFEIIDAISDYYMKRSVFIIKLLVGLSTFSGILFNLMLLFGGPVQLTVIYAIVYSVTLLLSFFHNRLKEHSKHIGYRALADSIRVQYYWGIAGVNDSASMCCYGYVDSNMFWLRDSLKSFASFFMNDYSKVSSIPLSERIGCVKDSWVEVQYNEIKKSGEKSGKLNILSSALNKLTSSINVILSIIMILAGLLIVEKATAVIYHAETLDADITNSIVLKLVMILCTALASMIVWGQSLDTIRPKGQADADGIVLSMTIKKLDCVEMTSEHRNNEHKQSILHELGLRVIDENCDWLIDSSKKDYKKKQNPTPGATKTVKDE